MMKGGSSFTLLSASVLLGTLLLLSAFVQEGQGLKCYQGVDADVKEVDCPDSPEVLKCPVEQHVCLRVEVVRGSTEHIVKSCFCHGAKKFCGTGFNSTHSITTCWCSTEDLCNNDGSCADSHSYCPRVPIPEDDNDNGNEKKESGGNSGAITPTLFLSTLFSAPALIIITSSHWVIF